VVSLYEIREQIHGVAFPLQQHDRAPLSIQLIKWGSCELLAAVFRFTVRYTPSSRCKFSVYTSACCAHSSVLSARVHELSFLNDADFDIAGATFSKLMQLSTHSFTQLLHV
jgi:hypothetical protein